jgi:hypothetical protein
MASWLTRRLEAADRANQNVPPWPGDETIEKHPSAWGATEGAYFGIGGLCASGPSPTARRGGGSRLRPSQMLVAYVGAVRVGLEVPAVPVELVACATEQPPVPERLCQLDRHLLRAPVVSADVVAVVGQEGVDLDTGAPFAYELNPVEVDAAAVTCEGRELLASCRRRVPAVPTPTAGPASSCRQGPSREAGANRAQRMQRLDDDPHAHLPTRADSPTTAQLVGFPRSAPGQYVRSPHRQRRQPTAPERVLSPVNSRPLPAGRGRRACRPAVP